MILHIRGTSTSNFTIYDENNNSFMKITHIPLSNTYSVYLPDGDYLCKINDCSLYGKYEIIDEDGNVVMEIGQKNNIQLGFGIRTFVALPLANIPFGTFIGTTADSDVYLQKNGKLQNVILNNKVIAVINDAPKESILHKLYGLGRRREIEFIDDGAEYNSYAILMFIVRVIALQQ